MPGRVFRQVEAELYKYPRYKNVLRNYRVDRKDVLHRIRQWPPPEGDTKGLTSDKTGGGAIRLHHLSERRKHAEIMVAIIDTVYETLTDEEQDLVRIKYFERNDMSNEQIIATMQLDHGTSRTQWYRMRTDVIEQFAEEMGFLSNGGPKQNAS